MPPTTGRSRPRADGGVLQPRRHRIVVAVALAVALAVVVVAGGGLGLVVGTVGAMASDPCSAEAQRALVCSARGQLLVGLLPLVGWLVAVVLGAVGLVRSVRRGAGGWWPMAIGVAVLGATVAISLEIADH